MTNPKKNDRKEIDLFKLPTGRELGLAAPTQFDGKRATVAILLVLFTVAVLCFNGIAYALIGSFIMASIISGSLLLCVVMTDTGNQSGDATGCLRFVFAFVFIGNMLVHLPKMFSPLSPGPVTDTYPSSTSSTSVREEVGDFNYEYLDTRLDEVKNGTMSRAERDAAIRAIHKASKAQ
jgi:hypothetical protein